MVALQLFPFAFARTSLKRSGGVVGIASVRRMKRSDGTPKPAMLPLCT
jgi:uncharacterized protein YqjF (DUF2071 family)